MDTANFSDDASRVSSAIAAANAQTANVPGPAVTGVALQTARHKITGLVISFNKTLADASATNPGNYPMHLMTSGHHTHGKGQGAMGFTVAIRRARYDPSAHTVTLVFGAPLHTKQLLRLNVRGGSGGITDSAGNALNSSHRGAAGADFTGTLNPGGS
jgi:hypothetical protein